MSKLLEIKQNSNKSNESFLSDMNISGNEGENKNYITVKDFRTKLNFLREQIASKK